MLKRTALLLILCLPAFPQNPNTAVFPSSLLTDQVSTVAKDRSTSVLDASIDADDLTLTVDTGHGNRFVQFEIITIENEQMMVCSVAGDTITICPGTRGFSWTTAVSHSNGADVSGNYVEWIVNQSNAEMKAVQELLGINGTGVLRTNTDSTTAAETTISFTPGVTKPGFRVGCGPLPSAPGTGGVLHCNSASANAPYWFDGTIWKNLATSFTGIANRGFERTGTNFSIDQTIHGYDHGNLIVAVYDYDTSNEIKVSTHVDRTAPYAVTLVSNLPSSRHMWVTIAGWGGPSGTASVHTLLSGTHSDTSAASPVLGDLLYASATPAWTKLAGNTTTTKKYLTQTGTGSVSAAPTWDIAGDITGGSSLTTNNHVPFVTGTGAIGIDTTAGKQLYRDSTTGNVAIGTATVSAKLSALSITEQLRLQYDASNDARFTVSSAGALTILPSGANRQVTIGTGISMIGSSSPQINAGNADLIFQNATFNGTSGTVSPIKIQPFFTPATGTMNLYALNVTPIVNQTGTATGSYRALNVDVTETAALGTSNYLAWLGAGGNPRFAIGADGAVGLGTPTVSANTALYRLTMTGATKNTVYYGINTNVIAANDTMYYASASNAVTGSVNGFGVAASASTGFLNKFSNTDNTNGTANSTFEVSTAGASGGDPRVVYTISGVQNWAHGVDNSDSDKFKISSGPNLGANDVMTMTTTGSVGIGTAIPTITGTGKLHLAGNTLRLDTARTPASSSETCNAGEIAWDASYFYICIAANTWHRAAHVTW